MTPRYTEAVSLKFARTFVKMYFGADTRIPWGSKTIWVAGIRYLTDQPGLFLTSGSTGLEGIQVIDEKKCSKCGEYKPRSPEYFRRSNREASGFSSRCKTCLGTKGVKRQPGVVVASPIPGAVGIPLTRGFIASVDPIDREFATEYCWQASSDYTGKYYAERKYLIDGKSVSKRMHRMIMERILGYEIEDGIEVDHINGDSMNNTRENLRLTSHIQNSWNSKMPTTNTSGLKGASYDQRTCKFVSQIVVAGKRHWLGRFGTAEEAHEAYCKKAAELRGEYARFD